MQRVKAETFFSKIENLGKIQNWGVATLNLYRLIKVESASFLLRHYKITQRWAKVFLKALVERNSVMVVLFYMILISQKYDQKRTILKG